MGVVGAVGGRGRRRRRRRRGGGPLPLEDGREELLEEGVRSGHPARDAQVVPEEGAAASRDGYRDECVGGEALVRDAGGLGDSDAGSHRGDGNRVDTPMVGEGVSLSRGTTMLSLRSRWLKNDGP